MHLDNANHRRGFIQTLTASLLAAVLVFVPAPVDPAHAETSPTVTVANLGLSIGEEKTFSIELENFADANYLAVLSVSAGTLSLKQTTGLTNSGNYTLGPASEIGFSGSLANIEAAVTGMSYSHSAAGTFSLSVSLSQLAEPTTSSTVTYSERELYLNPENGHYYEYLKGPDVSWTDAKAEAESRTLFGMTGYLATLTNAEENSFVANKLDAPDIWIGASDDVVSINAVTAGKYADQVAAEGKWHWLTGPEAGSQFMASNEATTAGQFSMWAKDEPNDFDGLEHYAVTNWDGGAGKWNDLPNSYEEGVYAFLVEYGGIEGQSSTAISGSGSATFTVAQSRGEPTVTTVAKVSPSLARIVWSAPTIPDGAAYTVSSYAVDYRVVGAATWSTFVEARSSSLPLRATVSGLDPATDYEFRVRALFSDSVSTTSAASSALTLDAACTLPGPRTGFVNLDNSDPSAGRELFLGGNFIELGISSLGNFGTNSSKPAGFFGTSVRSNIGMSVDYDGFGCGQSRAIDFFLPGGPEERYVLGYKESPDGTPNTIGLSKLADVEASGSFGSDTSQIERNVSIVDASTANTLKAVVTTRLSSGSGQSLMEVVQEISFGVNDQYFTNTVTIRNVTSTSWSSVRYMRSFDPDNLVDQGGDYDTSNEVVSTIAGDGKAVARAQAINTDYQNNVVASTYDTRAPILFYSSDSSARGSTFGFSNSNPYQSLAYDSPAVTATPVVADQAISIAFEKGPLAAGASTKLTYITSLDQRDFDVLAAEIAQVEAEAVEAAEQEPTNNTGNSGGSTGGPAVRPTVTPVITPIAPRPPRNITLAPQPPVQAPVLQNNQPSAPPNAPTANINGVPTNVSTLVTDPNNLNIRTGVLNIGVNVNNNTGLVRQGQNGETEVQVRMGGVTGLQGSGLGPRSFVQVFMPLQGTNAKELARIPVDETGAFNGEAVFATSLQDAPLPVGRQTLQMVTVDAQGRQTVVEFTVNIVQPPPSPELNREAGQRPLLGPGQSLATEAGVPVPIQLTVLPDQGQTVIEGDGWQMAVGVGSEDGVEETDEGGALLNLVRDEEALVSGDGFMPGTRADIWLFSEPTLLGTIEIDENGKFSGSVAIDPNLVATGEHTLQLQGVGGDGYVRAANLGVVVTDPVETVTSAEVAGGLMWWLWAMVAAVIVAGGLYAYLQTPRGREFWNQVVRRGRTN